MQKLLASVFVSTLSACTMPATTDPAKHEKPSTRSDSTIVDPWWAGDSSTCKTEPHDQIFYPPAFIPGEQAEFGVETGPGFGTYGNPGCEYAYIIDYHIPDEEWFGDMNWHSAWIHIAPRSDISTQSNCENTWTNMRVYGYAGHTPEGFPTVLRQSSRFGTWSQGSCHFDFPDGIFFQSYIGLVRVISQSGYWIIPGGPHYSYFVTFE
jgi:hypothetical protein